jgi:hypothetical protein
MDNGSRFRSRRVQDPPEIRRYGYSFRRSSAPGAYSPAFSREAGRPGTAIYPQPANRQAGVVRLRRTLCRPHGPFDVRVSSCEHDHQQRGAFGARGRCACRGCDCGLAAATDRPSRIRNRQLSTANGCVLRLENLPRPGPYMLWVRAPVYIDRVWRVAREIGSARVEAAARRHGGCFSRTSPGTTLTGPIRFRPGSGIGVRRRCPAFALRQSASWTPSPAAPRERLSVARGRRQTTSSFRRPLGAPPHSGPRICPPGGSSSAWTHGSQDVTDTPTDFGGPSGTRVVRDHTVRIARRECLVLPRRSNWGGPVAKAGLIAFASDDSPLGDIHRDGCTYGSGRTC